MRRWLFLLSVWTLSGCALWSEFKQPETTPPDSWKGQETQTAPVAWPDMEWWKQFRSAALTAQMNEAQKENLDLKAAVARVQQADAQVRISGAGLLPAIGASADVSRTRTPAGRVSSTGVSSGKPRINNNFNGSLNASYEIDFWGKNYSAAESVRALAEASRFDQQTVALTISSAVASNYFDILATQERLTIAKANVAASEKVLDAIRQRFDLGVATGLDMSQQENIVATQRATVPPLEQRLRQDLNAQAILLGKMPESMNMPDAKLADVAIPEVKAGLPSELLQRRPDVQNAEAQLQSAHANIVNARAAFFPSISLTASGGYASSALSQLFRPDSILWSIGSSLTQPIFEGGRLTGELDLAKARYEELLQNYRKAVISAFSDVEDALVAVQQTAALEDAQKAAEATARKSFDLSRQQMEGGIIDIATMLNTQRALFVAQDAYLQAKLSHLQAIVGLYKALGGGWQADVAMVAPPSDAKAIDQKQ